MITFGNACLWASVVAAAWALVAGALAGIRHSERLSRSAGRGLYAAAALLTGTTVACLWALVADRFELSYVAGVSRTGQPLAYKLAALWGGLEGSLVLWGFMLAVFNAAVVWLNRNRNRVLMPWVQATLGFVLLFFCGLIALVENPFTFVEAAVAPPDGRGLNPLLQNFWMMIHPPCLYLGFVGLTVPFAFAVAALITGQLGETWIRVTRRWTVFAWFFLGIGIYLGSYWSYLELGWGGYWFWDPVENASFMPWLVITAFLHSVMIQEKKGMLKVWNVLLIILSFCLAIFGTLITRSDILSSVHNFAGSRVGPHFGLFLAVTLTVSLLLVVWRLPLLRSERPIESMLSREASFLVNNLVLVGITGGVFYLTLTPVFSTLFSGVRVTAGPELFNFVLTPWFLLLIALMGVGPIIPWRRASKASLWRGFAGPLLVFAVSAAIVLGSTLDRTAAGLRAAASSLAQVFGGGGVEALRTAHEALAPLYAVLFFATGAFVVATVAQEFLRGARARMSAHAEGALTALARITWRNKRRYGGYLVHVGIVLIAVGVAGSSVYLTVKRFEPILPGQTIEADGYRMTYEAFEINGIRGRSWRSLAEENGVPPERPDDARLAWEWGWVRWFDDLYYPRSAIDWSAGQSTSFASPVQAGQAGVLFHNGFHYPFRGNHRALAAVVRVERDGRVLARGLAPQQRAYSWNDQPTTEVAIVPTFVPRSLSDLRRVGEDFYIIPSFVNPVTHETAFEVKVQPFVNWIWLGGLVLLLGTHLAVLPDRRESARIARLAEVEDRAVA